MLVVIGVAGCGDDGATRPSADVTVVEVAAQPCSRPTRDRGLGVVVAPDLVATAAHTVDGARREVTVDGVTAEVVAVDVRRDLALLITPTGHAASAALAGDHAGARDATVRLADDSIEVAITRTAPLVVTNVSDDTRVEREVHTIEPGVAEGTSGAPLVDADDRVLGIVLLDRGDDAVAYAVTASELDALLAEVRADPARHRPDDPVGCDS